MGADPFAKRSDPYAESTGSSLRRAIKSWRDRLCRNLRSRGGNGMNSHIEN